MKLATGLVFAAIAVFGTSAKSNGQKSFTNTVDVHGNSAHQRKLKASAVPTSTASCNKKKPVPISTPQTFNCSYFDHNITISKYNPLFDDGSPPPSLDVMSASGPSDNLKMPMTDSPGQQTQEMETSEPPTVNPATTPDVSPTTFGNGNTFTADNSILDLMKKCDELRELEKACNEPGGFYIDGCIRAFRGVCDTNNDWYDSICKIGLENCNNPEKHIVATDSRSCLH